MLPASRQIFVGRADGEIATPTTVLFGIRSVKLVVSIGLLAMLSAQSTSLAAQPNGVVKSKTQKALNAQSTKTAKSSGVSAKSSSKSIGAVNVSPGQKVVTPVALKSLSARVAVSGWDEIGSASWPDAGDSVIARAKTDSVDVFRNPADPNTSLRLIKGRSVAGPVVLMAVGASGDFIRVAIPLRPNGTLGWVRRSDVTLVRSTFRVEIDLSTNSMTVFDAEKVLFRVPVATGTGGTPTPHGLFFLKELVPQSLGGSLGPFAFGLSGFSNVLTSFGGGEGVIGIHGTNAPGKLGTNASHGCVRVDNVTISKMARLLPLGTPVEIVESSKPKKPTRSSSAWLDTLLSGAAESGLSPVGASLASAIETVAASPVVLLAEPVGTLAAPAPSGGAVVSSTSSAPTTTQPPTNDDPLGAVAAR
jgi:lipoprotein-anchoring transpeptidase ErfK/SrfK